MDQFVVAGACSDFDPNGNGHIFDSQPDGIISCFRVGQLVMFTKSRERQYYIFSKEPHNIIGLVNSMCPECE